MIDGLDEILNALQGEAWTKPQLAAQDQTGETVGSLSHCVENPVGDHPPLSQSVFAGDTVAVVLQSDLASPKEVVEAVLRQLMETNIEPTDITVVLSQSMASVFGLSLPEATTEEKTFEPEFHHPLDNEFRSINFLLHDSTDEQSVAYIAANVTGLPVKINRVIVDSDVVLTVGMPRPSIADDDVYDCIYPEYSNDETRQRYKDRKDSVHERKGEIELANSHLGCFFTIQLVAGIGNKVVNMIAGERKEAIWQARDESQQLWQLDPVGEAEMAIATIETDPANQSWKDFAKTLVAVNSVAVGAGPILIWSALDQKPKAEIRKAFNQSFETEKGVKLSRLLQQVSGILAERQVFLKSKLSQNLTEELGLGYVGGFSDVERLISGQTSGILLRDAHLCQVQLELENVDAQ